MTNKEVREVLQEPCEDCISRQKAIKTIEKYADEYQ